MWTQIKAVFLLSSFLFFIFNSFYYQPPNRNYTKQEVDEMQRQREKQNQSYPDQHQQQQTDLNSSHLMNGTLNFESDLQVLIEQEFPSDDKAERFICEEQEEEALVMNNTVDEIIESDEINNNITKDFNAEEYEYQYFYEYTYEMMYETEDEEKIKNQFESEQQCQEEELYNIDMISEIEKVRQDNITENSHSKEYPQNQEINISAINESNAHINEKSTQNQQSQELQIQEIEKIEKKIEQNKIITEENFINDKNQNKDYQNKEYQNQEEEENEGDEEKKEKENEENKNEYEYEEKQRIHKNFNKNHQINLTYNASEQNIKDQKHCFSQQQSHYFNLMCFKNETFYNSTINEKKNEEYTFKSFFSTETTINQVLFIHSLFVTTFVIILQLFSSNDNQEDYQRIQKPLIKSQFQDLNDFMKMMIERLEQQYYLIIQSQEQLACQLELLEQ